MTAPCPHGSIVWLTGLPGTGKTTTATLLVEQLHAQQQPTLWLDSDALRPLLTPHPTYANEERDFFYHVLGQLALLAEAGGVVVVISATASKQCYRDTVRAQARNFIEVWLSCPEADLLKRDIKQLYAQSTAGLAPQLPGRGAPYEAPQQAELHLDSSQMSPIMLATTILQHQAWRR